MRAVQCHENVCDVEVGQSEELADLFGGRLVRDKIKEEVIFLRL